ncbi:transposase [Nocardia brevicatena]|uniref:transposase n=1 Tax=Nocardia brevicatena TaxID=37327 RepID=UPI0012FA3CDC
MMIARILDAGVDSGWAAADAAYGRDGRFRAFCEARRLSYVLEVPVRQTAQTSTAAAAASTPSSPERPHTLGSGSRPSWASAANVNTICGLGSGPNRIGLWQLGSIPRPHPATVTATTCSRSIE